MESAPSTARRILFIDDDRLQQRLVAQMVKNFRHSPFELEEALTYEIGLNRLLSDEFAACLLDYRLGERDGLALLAEARAAGNHTPVVFLTADETLEVDIAATEAGAADYLVKGSLTPRVLERSLRYALKLGDTLAQLRRLAQRDELTGLYNRREFKRFLEEEWDRSVRFNRPFTLVMCDIDHFKKINDTHGHQVGDEVLKHVSQLFGRQVRSVDRLARYGGEEFALMMVETDQASAVHLMQRLGGLLADQPCVIAEKGLTVNVTISAGIATSTEDAQSANALVAAADRALYAAKAGGRNRIRTAAGAEFHYLTK
jgi:two-component system cell cycle response regulator